MSCLRKKTGRFRFSAGLWLTLLLLGKLEKTIAAPAVPSTPEAETLSWMAERKQAQMKALQGVEAFHDFQFTDQAAASQITFKHQIVGDAGKTFKPAHYDHGTGLAVADVDGDGLPDLYFVNQRGGNQLWRNLGNARFENITARAGVGLEGKICVGASFADVDNDGRPDLFVTTVRMGNMLFHNLGNGRFEDASRQSGLDAVAHSSGAVFFDFNNDGLLDLFVCNVGVYTSATRGEGGYYRALPDAFKGHLFPERSEASVLYLNQGGLRFKEVSKEMNLLHSGWSGDASFCDLNADGYPDLYVLNMLGQDSYYENQGGKSFRDRSREYFPKTPWGSLGLKFFDYDQDGRPDLYVTDMHSDMSPPQIKIGEKNMTSSFEKEKSDAWCAAGWGADYLTGGISNYIYGNAMFHNTGKAPLAESSERLNVETYWPWGPSVGDVNADGFEDIFVTAGMGYPYGYRGNSLLLNEAGQRFADAEFATGIEPRQSGTRVVYFTLDCGGTDQDNPLCEGKNGAVNVRSATSSRSAVILDLDGDGDLDIVVNDMNDRPQLLLSNLAEKKKIHWLKVGLKGTRSNADGLGATVKVYAGGRIWTQFNDGKSGYLSQSLIPLYFGLGGALNVEKMEVRWPSGKSQTVPGPISANQSYIVTEEK